jgi:hypothetical protein
MGSSAIVGGSVGASYGLGGKTLQAMAKPFTWVYDKVAINHETHGLEQAAPVRQSQPQTSMHDKITAEDLAKLNERTASAAGNQSFVKNLANQQMQGAPTSIRAGV